MTRALRRIMVPAVCCWLAACTTVGNGRMTTLSHANTETMLVVGKTTKADVALALGEGKVRPLDSGYEFWIYEYSEGLPKFVNYLPVVGLVSSRIDPRRRELRIVFDPQGVVKKYALIDDATSF